MHNGIKTLSLTPTSQQALMHLFPPRFDKVHADHITLQFGQFEDEDIDYNLNDVRVVGYQSTSFLEVLVVEIDGSVTRKSDRQILHITWSTQHGIPPVCSNDVLSELLYQPLCPVLIQVTPKIRLFN